MSKSKPKIKDVQVSLGKNIKPSTDKAENTEIKHPVFCLKYLNRHYHLDKCIDKEKAALISKMSLLSQCTWNEVHMNPRHALGLEKIQQSSIKGAAIPAHLTKDEVLYALRFDGMKAMVGYKSTFVFHIVYLDRDFTLYKH